MYYHTCELCGANLDPNEKCDCREEGKECARGKVRNRESYTQSKEYR